MERLIFMTVPRGKRSENEQQREHEHRWQLPTKPHMIEICVWLAFAVAIALAFWERFSDLLR